jgi:hypothetical protein
MSHAVLNYFAQDSEFEGIRTEADGPATRLYLGPPAKWPKLVVAAVCFLALAVNSVFVMRVLLRTPAAILAGPILSQFYLEMGIENFVWLAVGTWALLWQRKWGRTSRVLEAAPAGLTDWRPGFWRLRTRFIPNDRIERLEVCRAQSIIPGASDRLTLAVHMKNAWLPYRCELPTQNAAEAQSARDILAAAIEKGSEAITQLIDKIISF